MAAPEEFRENSQAVQSHLTILQSVIQRMATNSTAAKTWCVTLVSAVLVVVADKGKPEFAWLAMIPTILFLMLDAYYLGLERGFRKAYNAFIAKLHSQRLSADDLFVVVPEGGQLGLFAASLLSFSVWPFYATIVGMIVAAKVLVL